MKSSVEDTGLDHSTKSKVPELPDHPGDKPLQHLAQKWLDQAEAKLANAGLLAPANSFPSMAVNAVRGKTGGTVAR